MHTTTLLGLVEIFAAVGFCLAAVLPARTGPIPPQYYTLPPLREQDELQDKWTKERRENIPAILRNYNVDAWLVSHREYAEDTVFWSLKWARQFSSAGHNTMLFIANPKAGANTYNWSNDPDMWNKLHMVLEQEQLRSIAIDADEDIAFSSGLHAGELENVQRGLGERWASRLVSEPLIAVEYVATQMGSKAQWFQKLQLNAWAMISEAFSEKVITPGKTTTTDVEWWLREKLQQLNHSTWFHPGVMVIDKDNDFVLSRETRTQGGREPSVIKYGDLLHVDFGLKALGLHTDTQHLAYVLYPGETEEDIPVAMNKGLEKGNRVQDIIKSNMKIGKTGNEILKASLDQMHREGIEGKIYSHPIGDWGHAAGPSIGAVNFQNGERILGELPLLPQMYYSVELFVEHFVPEKNATLQFPLEEDIRHTGEDNWVWAAGKRQEKFHVIRTPALKRKPGDEL